MAVSRLRAWIDFHWWGVRAVALAAAIMIAGRCRRGMGEGRRIRQALAETMQPLAFEIELIF
jgi:hypothetical protein